MESVRTEIEALRIPNEKRVFNRVSVKRRNTLKNNVETFKITIDATIHQRKSQGSKSRISDMQHYLERVDVLAKYMYLFQNWKGIVNFEYIFVNKQSIN